MDKTELAAVGRSTECIALTFLWRLDARRLGFLNAERGRQSILWEGASFFKEVEIDTIADIPTLFTGPSRMRRFTADEVVQQKFIDAALSEST